MTQHALHDMHANSLAAFDGVELGKREALVLSCYLLAGVAITDRDAMLRLGFTDPNAVRPRVTSLVDRGLLQEIGNVRDEITGKRVRLCCPTAKAKTKAAT